MKRITIYQPLLRGIIYLLLIGQCLVGTAPLCYLVIDFEPEFVECYHSEDGELEKEKNKNEFSSPSYILKYGALISQECLLFLIDFQPLFYPNIITPPPEPFRPFA